MTRARQGERAHIGELSSEPKESDISQVANLLGEPDQEAYQVLRRRQISPLALESSG
jgi:hypothetical protein